jgi:hypothetical protein
MYIYIQVPFPAASVMTLKCKVKEWEASVQRRNRAVGKVGRRG